MTKPTEAAEDYFRRAQGACTRGILNAGSDLNAGDTFAALSNLCEGLVHLAVGVRATYLLVEEVQRKLNRPKTT
jgi:hypothetical protein